MKNEDCGHQGADDCYGQCEFWSHDDECPEDCACRKGGWSNL